MNSQQNTLQQSSPQSMNNVVAKSEEKTQIKAEQAQIITEKKTQKIGENHVKNLNQKVNSPKMKIQPKQTIKIKEEKMFDRVKTPEKFHSQSPPTTMKHRGLMDNSTFDDLNCRNDEESIMVSKNYEVKKRSNDASNSQRTSSRHAKISEEGHDIKIELEAQSQNSQDANETEIKDEPQQIQNQEQKEIVRNQRSDQNILLSSDDRQPNDQAEIKESSEQEQREQSQETPSSIPSVGHGIKSETSPSKAPFYISERQQNSHSSESNLSTPESRTGTGIQEDMALIDQNKREVVEPEEEDDPEASIVEMIFGRFKFRDFNQFAESQDTEQIVNDLNLDQLIRLGEEINHENSALKAKYSKIRLQMLIDDALKKRQNIGADQPASKEDNRQEFFGDNFQQNNVMFVDVEIDGDCQQQWNDQQNYSMDFDKQPTEKFRAKLYQLDGDGRWNDLGTGYFSIDHVPACDQGEGLYKMTLQQEHNSNIDLLENEIIQPHIQFHRQRETIITWTDKQRDQDLAVSFQNNSGAWQTWQRICQILGTDPDQNSQDSQVQEEFENFTVIARETIQNMAEELKNVNMLEGQIKYDIAEKFLDNDQQNLIKLGELFEEIESESLKNKKEMIDENLLCFFYIYKGLISLYDQRLLEMLLSNKYYMQTFGALEWDPDALQPSMMDPLFQSQQDIIEENAEGQNYEDYQDQEEYDAVESEKKTQQEIEESDGIQSQERVEQIQENDSNEDRQMQYENRGSSFQVNNGVNMNIYGINSQMGKYESNMRPWRFHQRTNKLWGDQIIHNKKTVLQASQDNEQQEDKEDIQNDEIEKEVQEKETTSEKLQDSSTVNAPETNIAEDAMEQDPQQVEMKSQAGQQSNASNFASDCVVNEQKSSLNYREFLSKIVKFKKVVDFTQDPLKFSQIENAQGQGQETGLELQGSDKFDLDKENQPTDEGLENGVNQGIKPSIEERIHINYRLQYLKDTVMARYIDEQASNFINQLIMANNREIVQYIFAQPKQMFSNEKSMKDQIIDKIRDKSDLNQRHQAIEFMIELCQILKNLSFSPGGLGGGGANQFIYGSGCNNTSQMNSRQIYEQLNSANFIGLLAETFSIFVPCQESFEAHYNLNEPQKKVRLFDIYRKSSNENVLTQKEADKNTQEVEEPEPMSEQQQIDQNFAQMERLDEMKVNSMEIIISFQQSVHVPNSSINKYLTGTDQCSNQYPFLKQLVNHLIYSLDQGIKVQICDFFKGIFDVDQNQHNSMITRDTLYNHILQGFVNFIQQINKDESMQDLSNSDDPQLKSHEYSLYLILQILNKVVAEHRYTLRQWICQQNAIPKIAKLVKLKSKLVNIEIVKFYKSLMRIKDPVFMVEITKKNLFYPINDIFVATYDAKNPPMIQSCIRELFEMILGKNIEKGDNDFPIPKIAHYLTRDDPKSKSIIFNPQYRDVFGKFHLQDGFSVDFVIDKNNKQPPYSSSNGGSPLADHEDEQGHFDSMVPTYQKQYMCDMKRKKTNKSNQHLDFQPDNLDDNCFLEYNSLSSNKANWSKAGFDSSQEILECEENGFENILSPSKQPGNKKELIHNYDEDDDRAEDAGSLSPLASKSLRNNAFQDDLFPEIELNEDHKNNKETSEYLFNYDLQDEDEEPKIPINLQLEKMSDDTNSNQNSQREPEFDIFNQNPKNQSENEDIEHNNKAFEQSIQDKKPQNLRHEQQQFKESLQQSRRQNSGGESNFLKQSKKDNLKISLFENFDNLQQNVDKYSSPKMSPRQTLTENISKNHSQVQESKSVKFNAQFKSKSLDKVSNSSSDFHFGDEDLAKDMGIFGASGSELKKQTCSVSSTSSMPMKSKIIQALGQNNRKQSPCSRSVSSQVVNNSIEKNINILRRKSFDDQDNSKVRTVQRINSAEKNDGSRRNLSNDKDQGRCSADKTLYLSAQSKNIDCNFHSKSGSQSPVPNKSDHLEPQNEKSPVLGIKRKIDPTSGKIQEVIQQSEKSNNSEKIIQKDDAAQDNTSQNLKKQKLES